MAALFRKKVKSDGQTVVSGDTTLLGKPYISGLLLRCMEHTFEVSTKCKKNLGKQPIFVIDNVDPNIQKVSLAASNLAVSIALKAMIAMHGGLPDDDRDSIIDIAVGASYACLLFLSFNACAKIDNVELLPPPILHPFISAFVYLDAECLNKASDIASELMKNIIASDANNVKEFVGMICETSSKWLLATSNGNQTEIDNLADQIYQKMIFGLRRTFVTP